MNKHRMSFLSVSAFSILIYILYAVSLGFAQEQKIEDGIIGTLKANFPSNVEINQNFDFDIWFQPKDPKFIKSITVNMEQLGDINYDQRVFELSPSKKKTIRAKIIKSRSGLVVIRAYSIEGGKLERAINAGFPLKFSSQQFDKPIESESIRYFIIDFTDNTGKSAELSLKRRHDLFCHKCVLTSCPREGTHHGYQRVKEAVS